MGNEAAQTVAEAEPIVRRLPRDCARNPSAHERVDQRLDFDTLQGPEAAGRGGAHVPLVILECCEQRAGCSWGGHVAEQMRGACALPGSVGSKLGDLPLHEAALLEKVAMSVRACPRTCRTYRPSRPRRPRRRPRRGEALQLSGRECQRDWLQPLFGSEVTTGFLRQREAPDGEEQDEENAQRVSASALHATTVGVTVDRGSPELALLAPAG